MGRRSALAQSLPIVFGLRIPQAAAAIGVSESHFRLMQERGRMPAARNADGVPVIDVGELSTAFNALDHVGGGQGSVDASWDGVTP